jgi:hypothetical protein
MTPNPSSIRLTRTLGGSKGIPVWSYSSFGPARADAELQAPLDHHVEGRCFLGQHGRMPDVVVEDLATNLDSARRIRRRYHRRNRGEGIEEVVGHDERGISEGLGPAGQFIPSGPRRRTEAHHPEAEWLLHCPASPSTIAAASAPDPLPTFASNRRP